jgi:hypothetical protein
MTHRNWTTLALALAALGCSSGDEGGGSGDGSRGPNGSGGSGGGGGGSGALGGCVDGDAMCGQACGVTAPCADGLYCTRAGLCAKDCVYGMPDAPSACGSGQTCNTGGQCIGAGGFDPGNPMPLDPGAWDGSLTGPGSMTCADTVVRATRVIPKVMLIVDQSGTMEDDFGGVSRWDALRDFLLRSPDGLIDGLQSQVSFGLALYSARSMEANQAMPEGECPMVTTVPPAIDNFTAIEAAYRAAEPIEDTPTGDSITKITDDLGLVMDPDAIVTPHVFVLATDGEPDRCEELDPQSDAAKDEAIAAVARAYTLGIRTFVISVGNEVGADHQQDIANAGLGRVAGDPDAEFWVAGDDQTLRDALSQVVGSQLSCEIALQGRVMSGDPCNGSVRLDGAPLACGDPNGWDLIDPGHIRVNGTACDALKAGEGAVI